MESYSDDDSTYLDYALLDDILLNEEDRDINEFSNSQFRMLPCNNALFNIHYC